MGVTILIVQILIAVFCFYIAAGIEEIRKKNNEYK